MDAEPGLPASRAAQPPARIGPRPLVLIALVDPGTAQAVTDALDDGVQTVTAMGPDAHAVAGRVAPDLIIADDPIALDRGRGLLISVRADPDLHTTPVLVLTDHPGAPLEVLRAGANDYLHLPFEAQELNVRATNLISIRAAESRLRSRRMADERTRIARDLHDIVIQRLFASGMRLNSVLTLVDDEPVHNRIVEVVDELDGIIRTLRTTIFDLQRAGDLVGSGLREEIMSLCADAAEQIGCTPRVGFDGPVDTLVPASISDQALAVLREALRNIVLHANAHRFEVVASATPQRFMLTVRDDGVGLPSDPSAGNGLRNMAARATAVGGTCTFSPNTPNGTVLRWSAPYDPAR